METESRSEKRLTVTVGEAARLLGIGRNSAYEAAHRGELPVVFIGKRILVPLAALERLLTGGGQAVTKERDEG